MKVVFISAVTSAVVSVSCYFVLQLSQEPYGTAGITDGAVVSAREDLGSSAALQFEVLEIRDELMREYKSLKKEHAVSVPLAISDLSARIAALEGSLKEISLSSPRKGGEDSDIIQKQLVDSLLKPSDVSAVNQVQSALAEIEFDNDSGIPLEGFSDSIDETFHSVEGLDVTGMDCRDTICKVTYLKSESTESEEDYYPQDELLDKLAQSAGGRQVEVRYDKDTSGKEVMYIQLR